MKQINLHVTPSFLKELTTVMKMKGIKTKSEAIRVAVHHLVEQLTSSRTQTSFRGWLGMGLKSPLSLNRQFKDEDALWNKK